MNPQLWGMVLVLVITYLFFEKKQVSEKEILQYIRDSDTIVFTNFIFIDENLHKHYHYTFFKNPLKQSTGYSTKEYILLEDINRKKYFELDYYRGISFMSHTIKKKDTIYALVNNNDLKNHKLGTRKKPIHILLFYDNEKYKNLYINEKQYLINVKEYLSYDR